MKFITSPKRAITWAYLILLFLAIIFSDPCGINKHIYFIPGLWLSMIIGYSWANHAAMKNEKLSSIKIAGLGIWDFIKAMAISLLLLIPVGILLPAYSCYTDRTRISEALIFSTSKKSEITEYYDKNKTLKGIQQSSEFGLSKHLAYMGVNTDAEIILVGIEPAFVLILVPEESEGKINWQCAGFPIKNMPGMCKNDLNGRVKPYAESKE